MDYRSGRSAMVLYACSDPEETLRRFVAGRGARQIERAVSARGALDPLRRGAAPEGRARPPARRVSWSASARCRSATQGRPAAPWRPRTASRRDHAPQLSGRRRRHRRRRRAGRAHQAARPAHPPPRGAWAAWAASPASAPSPAGYKEPLLVSCTDGVGTKLKLAFLTGRHDTVGIDLVAMSVNDLVVCGGEPLFFLDYFASGKLEVGVAERVIAGIADGCQAGRLRARGRRDGRAAGLLRGGRVRPGRLLRRRRREEPPRRRDAPSAAGDELLGLASSGFHSNGYSLVRKVFLEEMRLPLDARPPGLDEPLGRGAAAPDAHLRPVDARAGRRQPAARRRPHHRRRSRRQPDRG